MDKFKGYIINLIPAGMVGVAVAVFEYLFLNRASDLLRSSIIYFVFGAVIGSVSAVCYSWARYKGFSTIKSYLASMLGNGLSVFLLLMVLRTHQAYGWDAVISIILITQVLGLMVSYFENRYYTDINESLKEKKQNLNRER
ncbi:MAG: hypothetical protein ABR596_10465 [Halarsenatibacteraceae bacterium]